jgi:hypothetical protein
MGAPFSRTIVGVMLEIGRAPPRGRFGPRPDDANPRMSAGVLKSSSSSFSKIPVSPATTRAPNGSLMVVVSATTLPS